MTWGPHGLTYYLAPVSWVMKVSQFTGSNKRNGPHRFSPTCLKVQVCHSNGEWCMQRLCYGKVLEAFSCWDYTDLIWDNKHQGEISTMIIRNYYLGKLSMNMIKPGLKFIKSYTRAWSEAYTHLTVTAHFLATTYCMYCWWEPFKILAHTLLTAVLKDVILQTFSGSVPLSKNDYSLVTYRIMLHPMSQS